MSFIRRLFSFLETKNTENQPIPIPEYPFEPTYLPTKRTNTFLLKKSSNQTVSTQTEQTISNLTTKESETEINIPTSFVPKETSFSYLSSRFTSTNHIENEKINQTKLITANSVSSSQNSEPEDSKLIQNEDNSSHEFSIGSNQSSNNIPNDEKHNQITKEEDNGLDTFASTNFKKNTDTFSSSNFKPKEEKSKSDESSGLNYGNSTDTFSFTNFKPKEDKSKLDSSSGFSFVNNTDKSSSINTKSDESKNELDTFSFTNFKSKVDKKESTSSQKSNQPDDSIDTFSFTNFKSKKDTKETSNTENQKSKELDLEKIKAMLKERFQKPVFTTELNTSFNNREAVIQNESGGFNYTLGGSSHSYNRYESSGPKRGRGGKSKYNRNFNE